MIVPTRLAEVAVHDESRLRKVAFEETTARLDEHLTYAEMQREWDTLDCHDNEYITFGLFCEWFGRRRLADTPSMPPLPLAFDPPVQQKPVSAMKWDKLRRELRAVEAAIASGEDKRAAERAAAEHFRGAEHFRPICIFFHDSSIFWVSEQFFPVLCTRP